MKYPIIIALLLMQFFAKAQGAKVQTPKDSVVISEQIDFMRKCILKSSKSRSTAFALRYASYLPIVLGSAVLAGGVNEGLGLVAIGGVLQIIAIGLDVNSNEWLRKAGLGVSKKSAGVVYIFK